MFEFLNHKHLAEALRTQNHFLPILSCFLVSLAVLFLCGQFPGSFSQKRTPPDVPDVLPPPDRTGPHLIRPPQSLFDELKNIKNKFDILQIVIYTLVLIICGTFLLLFLVRKNYVQFIRYWFSAAYFLVLSLFSLMLLKMLLKDAGIPFAIDLVTVLFLLWNICGYQ